MSTGIAVPSSSRKRKASEDPLLENAPNDNLTPVYLRIRPTDDRERFVKIINNTEIEVHTGRAGESGRSKLVTAERYNFSRVFQENTSQAQLFDAVMNPMVEQLFSPGESSGLVLAYGASSSGKTFTTKGTTEDPGILLRTIKKILDRVANMHTKIKINPVRWNDATTVTGGMIEKSILSSIESRQDRKYEYAVYLSFAEIYVEQVYDLQSSLVEQAQKDLGDKIFRKGADAEPRRPIAQLKDDGDGRKFIHGQKETRIRDFQQAVELIENVMRNRSVLPTQINQTSSRSHLFSVVKVLRIPVSQDGRLELSMTDTSRIAVVDLAGAERIVQSGVEGKAHRETKNINKSLHTLAMCVEAMRENQARLGKKVVIPWRESKLTMLLQPYFEHGQARFIINVNPSLGHSRVTSEVFRFAQRAGALQRNITVKPSFMGTEKGNDKANEELTRQVSLLKKQLINAERRLMDQEMAIRRECATAMSSKLQEMEVKYREWRKQAQIQEEEKIDRKLDLASAMHKDQINNLERRLTEQSRIIEDQKQQLKTLANDNGENGVLQRQITYLTQELEVRTAALDAERECVLTLREQLRKASDNTGHGIGLITSFYIQIGVTADVQRSSKLQEAQQEIKELQLQLSRAKQIEKELRSQLMSSTHKPQEAADTGRSNGAGTSLPEPQFALLPDAPVISKQASSPVFLAAPAVRSGDTSDAPLNLNESKRATDQDIIQNIVRKPVCEQPDPRAGSRKRKSANSLTNVHVDSAGLQGGRPVLKAAPESALDPVAPLGEPSVNATEHILSCVDEGSRDLSNHVEDGAWKENHEQTKQKSMSKSSVGNGMDSDPHPPPKEQTTSNLHRERESAEESAIFEEPQTSLQLPPDTSAMDPDTNLQPIKRTRKLRSRKAFALEEIDEPKRTEKRYSTVVNRLPKRG